MENENEIYQLSVIGGFGLQSYLQILLKWLNEDSDVNFGPKNIDITEHWWWCDVWKQQLYDSFCATLPVALC